MTATLRTIHTDTAPPVTTTALFGPEDAFAANPTVSSGSTITGTDWGRPDAYLANATPFCIEHVLPHDQKGLLYLHNFQLQSAWDHHRAETGACLLRLKSSLNSHISETVVFAAQEMTKTYQARLRLSYKAISEASTRVINAPHRRSLVIAPLALPLPLPGYEKYQAANWDQFDAEPITVETLTYARRLLRVMPTSLGAPDAAPAADGSIALEWVPLSTTQKLNKLFLDIGPGEEWRAYWKMRDGKFDRITGNGFPDTTKATLKNLFDKLSG